MSLKHSNVIVFGPTGAIGGLVAREAEKRGAKVWLAMRDTSKTINEIPADVEKAGKFTRVQANLTDPASVAKAIAESGAKAAFVYLVFGAPDHLHGALKALRDGGVEHVVFLSTYGVQATDGAALRAIPMSDWTPWSHAQVEIGAEDLGFPSVVALRPSWFASNYLRNFLNRSTKPYNAGIVYEDAVFDNIAPEDIGGVGGAVLVAPPAEGKTVLYLCNSEPRTAKESWELVKKVTGRDDIDTTPGTPDAFIQTYVAKGVPEIVPKFLLKALETARKGFDGVPAYEAGVKNVKEYLGREPTRFVDYLEAHKADWKDI
ncbi:NmrA domain-containing protein [Mycena chlorophos]|uniref:NmrA domain-containing protein n=1 Tax=Mycena chlorophos TaxID=658473 RepID=A0A8H6SPA5_MYCCL|nr:NmrA domain-containing protein [Mycena chlorophos]